MFKYLIPVLTGRSELNKVDREILERSTQHRGLAISNPANDLIKLRREQNNIAIQIKQIKGKEEKLIACIPDYWKQTLAHALYKIASAWLNASPIQLLKQNLNKDEFISAISCIYI
ncbi:hypothetical protein GJ496_009792 [Pomphorhynchus laevis]|nr:hypothetical protein GJ496_009792 [Pomphorhynchus laevis]